MEGVCAVVLLRMNPSCRDGGEVRIECASAYETVPSRVSSVNIKPRIVNK
jgi:hypothetical protein